MPNNPKVSVWMCTYNHEHYIAQAIESVLAQKTSFDMELCIGEDCSTDGTLAVCRKYAAQHPDKIRLFAREKNLLAENSTRLYQELRGEYVAILEGDDFWSDPDKIQKQIDFLDANPAYAGVCTEANVFYEDRSPSHLYTDYKADRDLDQTEIISNDRIPTGSFLFKKFDMPANFSDLKSSDTAIKYIVARSGKVRFLNYITTQYRKHSGGMHTGARFGVRNLRQIDFINYLVGNGFAHNKQFMMDLLHKQYIVLAYQYAHRGDIAEGAAFFKKVPLSYGLSHVADYLKVLAILKLRPVLASLGIIKSNIATH